MTINCGIKSAYLHDTILKGLYLRNDDVHVYVFEWVEGGKVKDLKN